MTRTQQRINSIQNNLAKLLDVGSSTEAQGSTLLISYLLQAQKALDEAYLLAAK